MTENRSPAILVVDDDPAVVEAISLTLRGVGYTVVTAKDGKEALVKVYSDQSWREDGFPDLIVADIMMPVKDGYEFCEKVKKNPQTRDIPFIFLTVKYTPTDRAKALFLGCQRYLTKPFRRKELLQVVNDRLVDAEQTRALLAETAPVIEGDLSKTSILSLVDLFLIAGWSGKLYVARSVDVGKIDFRNGEVKKASWGGKEGPGALELMLQLREGSYRLERAG